MREGFPDFWRSAETNVVQRLPANIIGIFRADQIDDRQRTRQVFSERRGSSLGIAGCNGCDNRFMILEYGLHLAGHWQVETPQPVEMDALSSHICP